jgi:hypothetical protein
LHYCCSPCTAVAAAATYSTDTASPTKTEQLADVPAWIAVLHREAVGEDLWYEF